MTDNELIAEFMGIGTDKIMPISALRMYDHPVYGETNYTGLHYQTSWDWLMPVVEKIESLGYATKFRYEAFTSGPENAYHDIEIFSLNENNGYKRVACCMDRIPKIQGVYKAVVEFIKWYNQNK